MQRSIGQKPVTNGHTNGNHQGNGATNGHTHLDLDVCVVGAGFAGVYVLNKLRKEGFNAKIVEAASGLGGIWHWNSYPGARVDSQYPIYALSIPEVYKTWTWSEQYPGSQELRDYFAHIDKVLDISKDVLLETTVKSAVFDSSANKWEIRCDKGTSIRATFFICCIGFAARRHFPGMPNLTSHCILTATPCTEGLLMLSHSVFHHQPTPSTGDVLTFESRLGRPRHLQGPHAPFILLAK